MSSEEIKSAENILIVDDDPQVRGMLQEFLSSSYACTAKASAEEALAALTATKFGVILCDIKMGGMSGLEILPHVHERSPETVVVMISGEGGIETAIDAMRSGAFDYITKPFNLGKVERAVARAAAHHQLLAGKCRSEEQLRQSEERFFKAFQASPEPMIISRLEDGRYLHVNESFLRSSGYSADEVIGRNTLELNIWADPADSERLIAMLERDGRIYKEEVNFRLKSGEVRTGLFSAEIIEVDNQKCILSVTNDITERRAAQEALRRSHDELEERVGERTRELSEANEVLREQMAERERAEERASYLTSHDALTGLPNRVLFVDRLTQSLNAADRQRQKVAVMSLCVDRFKKFNDSLGHASADQLLRTVAQRLGTSLRGGDTAARFDGEEFSLILTQIGGTEDATEMARKIGECLRLPFHLDGEEMFATASIGISLYPDDGRDAQTLLRNAGAALYRAKLAGGDSYQFYTADMNERAHRRLSLENDLRRALARGEFIVYYQPKMRIDARQLVGMEALVRWQHPHKGLISPAEFIPLAEDTGLIVPLGEWVLWEACRQAKEWQREGFNPLRLAVNLSPRQFQQGDLLGVVSSALEETALAPDFLELELTESSIMNDVQSSIATLQSLKGMGVEISVDDFGSGYSSLSYLKHLPIDVLKIDYSFVRDMLNESKDAAIVMAIITLGHSLNLKLIAEGVESEEQLRFLRLLRCDEAQGYLYNTPLPADAFREMLLEDKSFAGTPDYFRAAAGGAGGGVRS